MGYLVMGSDLAHLLVFMHWIAKKWKVRNFKNQFLGHNTKSVYACRFFLYLILVELFNAHLMRYRSVIISDANMVKKAKNLNQSILYRHSSPAVGKS